MRCLPFFFALIFTIPTLAAAETPKAPCSIVKIGEAKLQDSPNGHFIFPTKIDGEPVDFIIDTGSPLTVLDKEIVEKLQLQTEPVYSGGAVAGISGQPVRLARTTLPDFEFGGELLHQVKISVALIPKLDDIAHGLIGAAFLNHFDYEFDTAGGKLRTFQPSHCSGTGSDLPLRNSSSWS